MLKPDMSRQKEQMQSSFGRPLREETASHVTAAVLRGGGSRRFGSNKALYKFKGKSLTGWALEGAALMTGDIYLLGGGSADFPDSAVKALEDLASPGGEPTPLRGICAASPHVREWLLLLACDIPFFNEKVLRLLWENRSTEKASVFLLDGRYQPFLALYPRSLLHHWEEALESGNYRLQGIIEAMPKSVLTEEDLERAGVERFRLANINTPWDLEALEGITF